LPGGIGGIRAPPSWISHDAETLGRKAKCRVAVKETRRLIDHGFLNNQEKRRRKAREERMHAMDDDTSSQGKGRKSGATQLQVFEKRKESFSLALLSRQSHGIY
jgi:hypothetical protein